MGCEYPGAPGEGCGREGAQCVGAIYGARCNGQNCDSCFFGELVETADSAVAAVDKPTSTATHGKIVFKPSPDLIGGLAEYGFLPGDVITKINGRCFRGADDIVMLHKNRLQGIWPESITIERDWKEIEIKLR